MLASARFNGPVLNGRLGSSPLHLAAAGGQIVGKQFGFNRLGDAARQADVADPVRCGAADRQLRRRRRSAARSPVDGDDRQGPAAAQRRRRASGWSTTATSSVDARLTVSDRDAEPALLSAARATMCTSRSPAITSARPGRCEHPARARWSPTSAIEHQLSTGAGHAMLDVPGLTFGPNLQPEELTRLTEGVIALVNGTISGQGRIDWDAGRQGHFDRRLLDRATSISLRRSARSRASRGTIHFNDLLGLTTPPGQVLTRQVDQSRHPRRERRDPLPAAAQPAGQDRARRMAVHGRPPDPRRKPCSISPSRPPSG